MRRFMVDTSLLLPYLDAGDGTTGGGEGAGNTVGTEGLGYVDHGYTGMDAEAAASGWGIRLEAVTLPTARQGPVLFPRRWVVERSFGWLSRFRRLAREYERLPETVAGLHLVAFSTLMLSRMLKLLLGESA